jgi:hypothetical protein
LRFAIGRGLDLLEQSGGDHELGFSSIEAYALERCERSASWAQKARGLAKRLQTVPVLEDALISGSINWSMAAVLATVVRPDDADFWLAEAARRTVREMKLLVAERKGATGEGEHLEFEAEAMRTLTLTVPREDAWCFEQAKLLARHLGEGSDADVMFGLVAESVSSLCDALPRTAIEIPDDGASNPQREWERELARMRGEAEVRCEARVRPGAGEPSAAERVQWADSPEGIDRQLRALSHEFVTREVAFGRALEAFFSADGWRRIGYATAAQYARERLGTSLSSIKEKRRLVKRLSQLRFLAEALERGELGYEAARLVARVATHRTVESWVTRAKERTLRHLREEIDTAELLSRWSDSSIVVPPSDEGVRRVEELERAVVSGRISAPPAQPQAATVTLRLRVHESTARDFRHWEAIFLRHRGAALCNTTFLRFACEIFGDTWRPRPTEVAYAHSSGVEYSLDLRSPRPHGRRRAAANSRLKRLLWRSPSHTRRLVPELTPRADRSNLDGRRSPGGAATRPASGRPGRCAGRTTSSGRGRRAECDAPPRALGGAASTGSARANAPARGPARAARGASSSTGTGGVRRENRSSGSRRRRPEAPSR